MPQFCGVYLYFFRENLSICIIPTYPTQNIEILHQTRIYYWYTQIKTNIPSNILNLLIYIVAQITQHVHRRLSMASNSSYYYCKFMQRHNVGRRPYTNACGRV